MGIFKKDTKNSITTELKTIAEILVEDFRFSRSYLRSLINFLWKRKRNMSQLTIFIARK